VVPIKKSIWKLLSSYFNRLSRTCPIRPEQGLIGRQPPNWAHQEFVTANARRAIPNLSMDLNNATSGSAFKYYFLLSYWPLRLGYDPELSQEALFYNKYFWFLKFVRLYSLVLGTDAGLEQQAFQMIKNAGFNVDWALLEEIEQRVESELQPK
jgi:hypothetical protein